MAVIRINISVPYQLYCKVTLDFPGGNIRSTTSCLRFPASTILRLVRLIDANSQRITEQESIVTFRDDLLCGSGPKDKLATPAV